MTLSESNERRDEVLTLFDKGWPATAISKRLKVGESTVYHLVSVRRAQGKEPAAERPKPPAEAKAILAAKRKKPGRKPKPAARAAVAKRPSQVEYIDLGNATTAAVKAHVSRVDDSTTIVDLRREVRVLRIERNALRAALDAIHGSDS